MKFRVVPFSISKWITLDTLDRDADPVYWNPRLSGDGTMLYFTGKLSNESYVAFKWEPQMKWYRYRQNNSGGFHRGPKYVYVQAPSYVEANNRVELGVIQGDGWEMYFDGCEAGMDCDCCGDRWFRMAEWDENSDYSVYEGDSGSGEEWFPWSGN
jgi:hypothetical protein